MELDQVKTKGHFYRQENILSQTAVNLTLHPLTNGFPRSWEKSYFSAKDGGTIPATPPWSGNTWLVCSRAAPRKMAVTPYSLACGRR